MTTETAEKILNKSQTLQLIGPEGPISRFFKGFEVRPQQTAMMENIIDSYNNNGIILIEAGTGTGKSLAYLIPAILWQRKHGERTVISTNTINLQEQLLFKDIPTIAKALNIECKAVLVKGMSNYLCLRKLKESRMELALMPINEAQELDKIENWSETTQDGSRSSLPFVPSHATWEKVGAEHDTCNHKDCPNYKECFYFKARKNAAEGHILIVNHHLLCSDLALRQADPTGQDAGILPPYSRVILDEAHNLEEIATDFFASHMNQLGFLHNLARISSEKMGKPCGKLQSLKLQILDSYKKGMPDEINRIMHRLNIDLMALRWDVIHSLQKACETFRLLAQTLASKEKNEEDNGQGNIKWRLREFHKTHPLWESEILPSAQELIDNTTKYLQELENLAADVIQLKNPALIEAAKGTLFDIKGLAGRLTENIEIIKNFISQQLPLDKVRWVEAQTIRGSPNTSLFDANLDVSADLAEYLFNRMTSTVLVSATLTTNHRFDFIRQRLGITASLLDGISVSEHIYDSPFDYQTQTLLAVPTDIPAPTHPEFTKAAAEQILMALKASQGNAFVLFTSYTMLKACYEQLLERMVELRLHPMKQGDTNRQMLIAKFKTTNRAVLFGTDSFWEGVDVAGDALRCVILVKLPFRVPTEPILQARSEYIISQGGDAFMEYSLPRAIVKFKQGFGRLIRHKQDRGCILCLDSRLINKGYGKQFLASLPNCRQIFETTEEVHKHINNFYKRRN